MTASDYAGVVRETESQDQRPKIKAMTLRRMKTYTGGQGYVYQYYFVGRRAALEDAPDAPGSEYIFDVTSDRKITFAVSVFLSDEALRGWAGKHGRNLNEAEQYGVAKIRLFDAFDEIEDMMSGGRRLSLSGDLLEDATKRLSLE